MLGLVAVCGVSYDAFMGNSTGLGVYIDRLVGRSSFRSTSKRLRWQPVLHSLFDIWSDKSMSVLPSIHVPSFMFVRLVSFSV